MNEHHQIEQLINALGFKKLSILGRNVLSTTLGDIQSKQLLHNKCGKNELLSINWKTTRCLTLNATYMLNEAYVWNYETLDELAKSAKLERGIVLSIYVELENDTKKLDPDLLRTTVNEKAEYFEIPMTDKLRDLIKQHHAKESVEKPSELEPKKHGRGVFWE